MQIHDIFENIKRKTYPMIEIDKVDEDSNTRASSQHGNLIIYTTNARTIGTIVTKEYNDTEERKDKFLATFILEISYSRQTRQYNFHIDPLNLNVRFGDNGSNKPPQEIMTFFVLRSIKSFIIEAIKKYIEEYPGYFTHIVSPNDIYNIK